MNSVAPPAVARTKKSKVKPEPTALTAKIIRFPAPQQEAEDELKLAVSEAFRIACRQDHAAAPAAMEQLQLLQQGLMNVLIRRGSAMFDHPVIALGNAVKLSEEVANAATSLAKLIESQPVTATLAPVIDLNAVRIAKKILSRDAKRTGRAVPR